MLDHKQVSQNQLLFLFHYLSGIAIGVSLSVGSVNVTVVLVAYPNQRLDKATPLFLP
jgi:hypothetical protein